MKTNFVRKAIKIFAASTYDETIKYEQGVENKEMVIFLFIARYVS